jgi:hypothetical protein
MQTNVTLSRGITVGAAPGAVLDLLEDPAALPRWAPGFADRVRPGARDRWLVESGGRELEIRVRVVREAGTVDLLGTVEERGLFMRVLPSGQGSEVLFALVLPEDTPAPALARQIAVLDGELKTVRTLCEPQEARS